MVLADIGDSFERGLDELFTWIPNLLGALAVLAIGYVLAKVVSGVVRQALRRGGLDRRLQSGQTGRFVGRVTRSPSRFLGTLTFWAILIGAISLAVSVLGIDALEDFVAAVYGYLPNLLAAFLIFLVAGAIAAGISVLVSRTLGDTPTGKIVGTIAPAIVMAIAVFMILDQLRIAEDIVRITYAGLIAALVLAAGLAFGLGGREVAAEMLRGAYERSQLRREQMRRDLEQGRARAREEFQRARGSLEGDEGPSWSEDEGDEGRIVARAATAERGGPGVGPMGGVAAAAPTGLAARGFFDPGPRFIETKPSWLTSEFWILVATLVALWVYTAADDAIDADRAWILTTILVSVYMLSRGIAKAGSGGWHDPDPGDDL